MSKRQTLAEQVGTQAIELRDLNAELATIKADFRTLEQLYEALQMAHEELQSAHHSCLEEVGDLKTDLEKAKKEAASNKTNYDYTYSARTKAEEQIEQAHTALDAIPEALSREYDKEYGKGTRDLSSRIIGTILAVVRSGK